MHRSMKTSTLFAALCTAAAALCAMSAEAQTAPAAPRAAASTGTRHALVARRLHRLCPGQQHRRAATRPAGRTERGGTLDGQIQPPARPETPRSEATHRSAAYSRATILTRTTTRPRVRSTSRPASPYSRACASTARSKAANSTWPQPCRIWNVPAKTCRSTS